MYLRDPSVGPLCPGAPGSGKAAACPGSVRLNRNSQCFIMLRDRAAPPLSSQAAGGCRIKAAWSAPSRPRRPTPSSRDKTGPDRGGLFRAALPPRQPPTPPATQHPHPLTSPLCQPQPRPLPAHRNHASAPALNTQPTRRSSISPAFAYGQAGPSVVRLATICSRLAERCMGYATVVFPSPRCRRPISHTTSCATLSFRPAITTCPTRCVCSNDPSAGQP